MDTQEKETLLKEILELSNEYKSKKAIVKNSESANQVVNDKNKHVKRNKCVVRSGTCETTGKKIFTGKIKGRVRRWVRDNNSHFLPLYVLW